MDVFGYPVREPYPTERGYFVRNPHVAGMAAEDGQIVLNPFSQLGPSQREAVAKNEAVRLWLRNNQVDPDFELTPEQQQRFGRYGSPLDIKHTILGRILSGDPSAGTITPRQQLWADRILAKLLAGKR